MFKDDLSEQETAAAMTEAREPEEAAAALDEAQPDEAACMTEALEPEEAAAEADVAVYAQAVEAAATPQSSIRAPSPPTGVFPSAGACPPGYEQFTIPFGWDVGNVLVRYGISYQALQHANPSIRLDALYAGLTICVPPAGEACANAAPAHGNAYIMRGNDTIDTVARRFHTTASALLKANPSLAPQQFTAGTTVWIVEG